MAVITHEDIRLFLIDDPETNLLLGDYEYTPAQITKALQMSVDVWNETPPTLDTYTVETFPWRHHLLLQTTAYLLTIAANGYMRNNLQYNISGGSVDDKAKAAEYLQAAQMYSSQFKEWLARKKAELNHNLGWSTV